MLGSAGQCWAEKEYLFKAGERVWIDNEKSPFNDMEAIVMKNTSQRRVPVYLKGKLPPEAKGKGDAIFDCHDLTRESEQDGNTG